MPVTPNALPCWQRSASIESLDGHVDKQNVQGLTAYNPKTQCSAEGFSSLVDYVIAGMRTMPFATINVTTNDTSPGDPTINSYFAQHGVGVSLAPTVSEVVDGIGNHQDGYFAIQWDASYEDSYSQTGSVNLTAAQVSVAFDGDVRIPTHWFATSTLLYVQVFTDLGSTAAQDVTVTVSVW